MPDNLRERILSILERPRLASLATVTEEGTPWVRYVMTQAGEDMKIRCATFVRARKVAQISRNPEVHITCGVTDPMAVAPYLQVQGRAFVTTAEKERRAFWYDLLSNIFTGPDDSRYGVIIIVPYRIEYCIPGQYQPEVWTG